MVFGGGLVITAANRKSDPAAVHRRARMKGKVDG